jgi:glycosyltransferase involved in cell wall biosynthesis
VDVVHAHDWLSGPAAISIKNAFRLPLVSTIHATEHGRRHGIHDPFQRMINDIEGWLAYNSWRVIVCSHYMEGEVASVFSTPREKIDVIPNGVDYGKFDLEFDAAALRPKFALPDERIVLYVGRLVHEKGLGVLVGAIPKVLASCPDAKFVIVGSGYMKGEVQRLAWELGVAHKTLIPGYLDEEKLLALYRMADVAVCPSLYEPFGIVALEGMAAGLPTVVTDTGGLAEIVEHDETGVKVWVDSSDSLAWGITRVLKDRELAARLGKSARAKVERVYDWDVIARDTVRVYERVLAEHDKGTWKPTFSPAAR